MSYGCYIVDDEPGVAALLIDYVNRHEELHLLGYEQDPFNATQKLLSGEIKADLCFLDVQMGGITGVEIADKVRNLTTVIFISAFKEYAFDSYEVDAVDYLLKPVRYVRFAEAIEKAKRLWAAKVESSENKACIFVKDVFSGKLVKMSNADLIAIEGNGNYVFLHIAGLDKPIMTNLTMKSAAAKLPDQSLVRTHKQYIVNLEHVTAINGNEIQTGSMVVPLSRRYRNHFFKAIEARESK